MTDNTSPVATLAASLPKGNGLTRAAGQLHGRKGALVPFIGYLRVEEVGEDLNDVLKVKTTIQRLELCTGSLEHDAKSLLARATTAANEYGGQQTLFAEPGTEEEETAEQERLLRFLREWQTEQTPPLDDETTAARWNSFHGGFYDARPERAKSIHLREFLINIGALTDGPASGADENPVDDEEREDTADGAAARAVDDDPDEEYRPAEEVLTELGLSEGDGSPDDDDEDDTGVDDSTAGRRLASAPFQSPAGA